MNDARQPTDGPRRRLLRWSAFALLGGGILALIGRKGWSAPIAACDRDRVCARCDLKHGCVQPEAMSWRHANGETP